MQRRKDNKGRVLRDGESYRKSDGLYMYRWTDKIGKRHTKYAKTLEELRKIEDEILHDIRDGIKIGEGNITVNDVYEMWKKDKVGLKQTTFRNYTYMYEHFIKEEFGTAKVQSVTKSDVRRLYNSLVNENTTKHMSCYTLDSIHTVLHQVFQTAVDDKFIRENPSDGALVACRKAHNFERTKRHSLTIPEQTRFIKFVYESEQYKHWGPLFTTFLGTGVRVSELVGLRWEDVDMENSIISINHNMVYYQRSEGKCYFSVTTPKTAAGVREIPMLPKVKQAFLEEKKYQEEVGIKCNASVDGYTDFIFLNRFGNAHNSQTINRSIKRIVFAANEEEMELAEKEKREPVLLPQFSCHNLRHTFCTRYCENETNIKVIQSVMGHKDIATTMDVYAEATKEAKAKSFVDLQDKITI